MMTMACIDNAISEARRFINRADIVLSLERNGPWIEDGCKETAALRRTSMELTRALADLRRSS